GCSCPLGFGGGGGLEGVVRASALGGPAAPVRAAGVVVGVFMLPVERAGVLRMVEGRREAAAVPGITGVSITLPVGQSVRPLPEGDRYLGFIFADGESHAEVETALRLARRRLRVVIE